VADLQPVLRNSVVVDAASVVTLVVVEAVVMDQL
jgi:hypothetical protein